MRLQADPTVVYALKKEQEDFSLVIRRVLKKDLKIKSPYNTYRTRDFRQGPLRCQILLPLMRFYFQRHTIIYILSLTLTSQATTIFQQV